MLRLAAVALSLACLTAFAAQATAGERHVSAGFATYGAHQQAPVMEVRHGHHHDGCAPAYPVYYPAPVIVRRPVVAVPVYPPYRPYPVYRPYATGSFYYSSPGFSIGIGY